MEVDEDGSAIACFRPALGSLGYVSQILGRFNQRNAEEIAEEINDSFEAQPSETSEEKAQNEAGSAVTCHNLWLFCVKNASFGPKNWTVWQRPTPYTTVLDIFVRVNSAERSLMPVT